MIRNMSYCGLLLFLSTFVFVCNVCILLLLLLEFWLLLLVKHLWSLCACVWLDFDTFVSLFYPLSGGRPLSPLSPTYQPTVFSPWKNLRDNQVILASCDKRSSVPGNITKWWDTAARKLSVNSSDEDRLSKDFGQCTFLFGNTVLHVCLLSQHFYLNM